MTDRPVNTRPRIGKLAWRALPTFALGVLITVGLASVTASRADADADRRFTEDSERAADEVGDEIQRHLVGVDDLSAFVSLTWPTPTPSLVEYHDAVWGEERFPAFSQTAVIARVPQAGLEGFVAWQHRNGDPDFEVWSLGPAPEGDRLLLVGTKADQAGGRALHGFDVSSLLTQIDVELPTVNDGLQFVPNDDVAQLVSRVMGLDLESEGLETAAIASTDALLLDAVSGRQGEIVAYLVVPVRLGSLLEAAVLGSSKTLDITLELQGADDLGVVGQFTSDSDGTVHTHHQLERTVDAAGMRWTIRIGAGAGFGRSSSPITPATIVLAGLAISLLLAVTFILRRFNSEQLVAARFELDMARTLAETDSLTGLLNREGLAAELARSRIDSAAVLFLDLDDFKSVNDELGHEAGDRTLRSTAASMRSALREHDLLARLGGDEFIAVLPGLIDHDRVLEIAERVRVSIVDELDGIRVTASVGVSVHIPGDPMDFETVLHRADVAMYGAKRAGGDSVLFDR